MKRLPLVLFCGLARAAAAQISPAAAGADSAYEPQNVEVKGDGRCMTVRPGDTVHYTLTVEGVGGARGVFADLRLRLGHTREAISGGLPIPDFRSLGGGGLGMRDEGDAKQYHFAFKVPQEIFAGTYRGTDVYVRADQPAAQNPVPPLYGSHHDGLGQDERAPHVEVTRHTRDQIHVYCLNVVSNFGVETRPFVTNFEPGPVDSGAPSTPSAPATPTPAPLQPPPQPR